MTFDEVLDAHIERSVRAHAETLARPVHVNQRNVERVLGMPPIDFLEDGRAGAFPTWKIRRLVYAKTADVIAYIETAGARERTVNDEATDAERAERAAFARSGARRVAR